MKQSKRTNHEKKGYFVGLTDQVEYLATTDDASLTTWLTNFLSHGYSTPLVMRDRGVSRAMDLVSLCQCDDSGKLGARVGKAALEILRSKFLSELPPALVIGSLIIIGELRVTEAYDYLVRLAKTSTHNLRDINYENLNSHSILLRVLIGLGDSFDLDLVLARDAKDPRYCGIIFRGLWEYGGGNGTIKAIHLLPDLLDVGDHHEEFHTSEVLLDFMACLETPANLAKLMPYICVRIGPRRLAAFINACREVGIEVIVTRQHGFLIDWRLVGSRTDPTQATAAFLVEAELDAQRLSAATFAIDVDHSLRHAGVDPTLVWRALEEVRAQFVEAMIACHVLTERNRAIDHVATDRYTKDLLLQLAGEPS